MANGTFGFRALAAVLLAAALATGLLALVWTKPAEAAFPGSNGKIAFVSFRDENFEIYIMNPNGSMQTRLTNNSAGDDEPAFSPNGKKIAFSRGGGNSEIYKMNAANGSMQTQLTNSPKVDSDPDWGVRP
jgi:Tol biopolymer transport system component